MGNYLDGSNSDFISFFLVINFSMPQLPPPYLYGVCIIDLTSILAYGLSSL